MEVFTQSRWIKYSNNNVKKKDLAAAKSFFMEMGGIEPPSEKVKQVHLQV